MSINQQLSTNTATTDREDPGADPAAGYERRPTRSVPASNSRRLSQWRHHASRLRTSVDAYTLDTFNPSPFLCGPHQR